MPPADDATTQPLLVGVRFRETGKIFRYDAGQLALARGDQVVVATDSGTSLGTVVLTPHPAAPADEPARQRVLRKADARDLSREEHNHQRAREALRVCLQRIDERRLPMKLIKAERPFDGSKVIFYFASEGRVDFRELVRDLAHTLHTRIEMKQIGARDETKIVGGVGPCGRELCCSCWLTEFVPVAVKMAKEQGLSLNPGKLAGMCGRLKCCLRYEYDTYVALSRALPAVGAKVSTVKGDGLVTRQNVLQQTVTIKQPDGAEIDVTLDDPSGGRTHS